MASTTTTSLVLFPSTSSSYQHLQLTASLPLPPSPPSNQKQIRGNMNSSAYTKFRRNRSISSPARANIDLEKANVLMRSEDGLLSPPPRFTPRPRPPRIRTTPASSEHSGGLKSPTLLSSPKTAPSTNTRPISPSIEIEMDLLNKRRENKAREHAFSRPAFDNNLLIQPPRPSLRA